MTSIPGFAAAPKHPSYDVVIVGAAAMGAASAFFLASDPDFRGRILVLERDPSFATASTSHSNSCIRLQFSTPVNIRISRFGLDYLRDFRARIGDPEAPAIHHDGFGYLYLAATRAGAETLRANHAVQAAEGAAPALLEPAALAARFPFMETGDIRLAALGGPEEGYFDGATMVSWWRRRARALGVEFVASEVTGLTVERGRIARVRLAGGVSVAAGHVVNAAGPRAAEVAAMAGVALPVAPRKRTTVVFEAANPLPCKLPLTIDPSGVHVRSDGALYMAGCGPMGPDDPVAPDDFAPEPRLWEEKLWPAIAARIPAFERLRVVSSWVGHYAWNALDQNAVIGPVPERPNLVLVNGFSGHGLQQAPAMGRAVGELILHGRFLSLDLSDLGYDRVAAGRPFAERAVI